MSENVEVQYTEQEIKTMFKVAKRLQVAFSDIKKLTTKYLIKVKKIKSRKLQALVEEQENRKKQQHEKRKRERHEAIRQKREKQRDEKQKERNEEREKKKEKQLQPKPIFTILKEAKEKQKEDKKQSKPKAKNMPNLEQNQVKNDPKQKFKSGETGKEGKIIQKPVEPELPYFRFLRMKKYQIRSSIKNIPMEQTSKIMRAIWDKMTEEQRRPYVQYYQAEKAKYERDMHSYYQNLYKKGVDRKKIDQMQRQKQKDEKIYNNFDFIDELYKT